MHISDMQNAHGYGCDILVLLHWSRY